MTSPRETTTLLKAGDKAPDFTLQTFPAGTIKLADFQGKKNVILAFYPKDDTPGCTKEMCAFSEDLGKFAGADTEVLGISCDSVASHGKFADKYNLKQTLLADEKCEAGAAYGAAREGHKMTNRVLFVIDKSGVIRHVHEGMPDNAQLLSVLSSLK